MNILLRIFFISLCFYGAETKAQIYSFNNGFTNGQTISACTGTFYDVNTIGNYTNNEYYSVTFCAATPGKKIQISFNDLNIGGGDTLFVYDGSDTFQLSLDTLVTGSLTKIYTGTTAAGCLTFKFKSDNQATGTGWIASMACRSPCQQINATIVTTPAINAQGYLNVCLNQTVQFTANVTYPQNNAFYTQSNTTSKFKWTFNGLGIDTTTIGLTTISRTINNSLGYRVSLEVLDSNGCQNAQPALVKLRTSIKPTFNIIGDTICLRDTAILLGKNRLTGVGYTVGLGSFVQPPESGDSLAIPDGPTISASCGIAYTDTISVSSFPAGQTMTSISDFQGVFLNMEHSYLGDLNMELIAPNGQSIVLKGYRNQENLSQYLGRPVASESFPNVAGTGYLYGFTPTPALSTMRSEAPNAPNETYVDNSGTTRTHKILRPGDYTAETPFINLIGTPLNGKWIIKICDNFHIDNGYLFTWRLKFNPALYPAAENYSIGIMSAAWVPGAPGLIYANRDTAIVSPSTAGTFNYTFRITDSASCVYDSAVKVLVNPLPIKPNLGPDTTMCEGQTITLNVINPQGGNIYTWSSGQAGVTSINITQPNIYTVTAQTLLGCKARDTITVTRSVVLTISLGNDTLFCASQPNVLTPQSTGNIVSYLWNTGSTSNNITTNGAGLYWVQGTNPTGCFVRDSISISDNPINRYSLPNDTTICDRTSYTLTLTPPATTAITWFDGTTGYSHLIDSGRIYGITANYKGCLRTDDFTVGIRPLPIVNLGRDTALCYGFDLPLKVSYPGAAFLWSTGSADTAIVARTDGSYSVKATLNGCSYSDTLALTLRNCVCEVKLPNAFSPNGDGINDVYRADIQCFPKDYRLSVFDRYGQIVFETRDYKAGWDGKIKGRILPVATYYYILTFYNDNLLKNERFTGSITLLR